MKKLNKKGFVLSSSKGFTLIEVVLVLAIGGLIFLLAFIAFQQVSANRRDTQRRADAGRVAAEVQNYAGDNQGNIPPTTGTTAGAAGSGSAGFNSFINIYMNGNKFTDPNGTPYNIVTTAPVTASDILYTTGATCTGSGGAKDFKIEMKLEKGLACRDSGR